MAQDLNGKRVAILVAQGFEQVEMTEPRKALDQAGAQTVLISPEQGQVKAWNHTEWGQSFDIDMPLRQADADGFDALLIPGGVMSPDHLRMQPQAVEFVREFFEAGKPVASICHGPWLLAEAGVIRGRTVTSYPSIRTDLKNAGAHWVDQEAVTDQGLVTSRNPDDLPAFCQAMIEEFAEGPHPGQRQATMHQERPSAH